MAILRDIRICKKYWKIDDGPCQNLPMSTSKRWEVQHVQMKKVQLSREVGRLLLENLYSSFSLFTLSAAANSISSYFATNTFAGKTSEFKLRLCSSNAKMHVNSIKRFPPHQDEPYQPYHFREFCLIVHLTTKALLQFGF